MIECIKEFIESMKKLGYSAGDSINLVEKYWDADI